MDIRWPRRMLAKPAVTPPISSHGSRPGSRSQALCCSTTASTALAALAARLTEAGYALVTPELDQSYRLTRASITPLVRGAARLTPGQATRPDWHNDRAAFLVALNERLQSLANDPERTRLLSELNGVLEGYASVGKSSSSYGKSAETAPPYAAQPKSSVEHPTELQRDRRQRASAKAERSALADREIDSKSGLKKPTQYIDFT